MQILFSSRLRLEALRSEHAELLFLAQQDPIQYAFIPQEPLPLAELRRRYAFLESGRSTDGSEHWLNWVAVRLDDEEPIGTFQATVPPSRQVAIAYAVFPSFWGNGFASEMGRAVIPHLFERYEAQHIYAEIDTRNVPSIKLVEKWGFRKTGFTEAADFFKGTSSDEFRFELSLTEWSAASTQH